MINIIDNGSKWPGEKPDTLKVLKTLLKKTPLNPKFENYGNFVIKLERNPKSKQYQIWGNFYKYSHVFNIHGTKRELILIIKLIRKNQRSEKYQKAKSA